MKPIKFLEMSKNVNNMTPIENDDSHDDLVVLISVDLVVQEGLDDLILVMLWETYSEDDLVVDDDLVYVKEMILSRHSLSHSKKHISE